MATLYIVATPIGNLGDVSQRVLHILAGADIILCEDTRETRKLLNHFGIKTGTMSYHQHSSLTKVNKILALLKTGKDLALVSDAGTPGLSDPGNKLVAAVLDELVGEVTIVPIPGPSALTAAISVSGFAMDKFLFLGFPPQKKKRNQFFQQIAESSYPVVIYESPHRIIKTLKELEQAIQPDDKERRVFVARELTKYFETLYRGQLRTVIEKLEKEKIKGEFVVILEKK